MAVKQVKLNWFMEEKTAVLEAPKAASPYSRKNPFLAELTRHDRLTGPGSSKDTRHFVLNLVGSGLTYTPGDSLGVFGRHSPELVEAVISLLGFNGGAAVNDPKGQPTTLRQALLRD
jgi:sulfite reductase (NADPH) flavoprotein alpha-component